MHNTITPSDARDALMAVQISNADAAPSLALQFTALTVSRITPVRLARLTDIDKDNAIWRIPVHHNKSGFEQQVPLSRNALSVLERAEHIESGNSDLVFPSRSGTVLINSTLYRVCEVLNLHLRPGHFRTAFAVWCAESSVPQEIADVALGIKPRWLQPFKPIPLFLKRRALLMQAWADFLAGDLPDNWRWQEPGQEEDLLRLNELFKSLEEDDFDSH